MRFGLKDRLWFEYKKLLSRYCALFAHKLNLTRDIDGFRYRLCSRCMLHADYKLITSQKEE